MHPSVTPEANARWSELLSVLAERSEEMADEFVERVAGIREYGTGLVAAEDLRETAAHTFALLVAALRADGAIDDGALAYARELGGRRARAGIPPSSLTSAVRLDFSIIWSRLLELAADADAVLLAARVESVWHVVDQYAAETHSSYLAERVRMAQEESSVQREFVAQLFGPESLSPDTVTRIGAALRVDASASFVLAAGSGAAGAVIRALGAGVPGRVRVHVYEAGNIVYGFWQAPRTGNPVPAGLVQVPCGLVRDVSGLTALRPCSAVAAALADEASDDDAGPLELEAAWHRVARRLLEDAGISLAVGLDRSLEACRESERERLEETARTFMANGSVTETASALYCHRNTILNRLARFHELTGVDLTVPQQAARVLVAWG